MKPTGAFFGNRADLFEAVFPRALIERIRVPGATCPQFVYMDALAVRAGTLESSRDVSSACGMPDRVIEGFGHPLESRPLRHEITLEMLDAMA